MDDPWAIERTHQGIAPFSEPPSSAERAIAHSDAQDAILENIENERGSLRRMRYLAALVALRGLEQETQ